MCNNNTIIISYMFYHSVDTKARIVYWYFRLTTVTTWKKKCDVINIRVTDNQFHYWITYCLWSVYMLKCKLSFFLLFLNKTGRKNVSTDMSIPKERFVYILKNTFNCCMSRLVVIALEWPDTTTLTWFFISSSFFILIAKDPNNWSRLMMLFLSELFHVCVCVQFNSHSDGNFRRHNQRVIRYHL